MSSPLGLMAPSIIDSDAVQGETFLPGQIFVFGGFALRANSLGHLEQIDSYAPGHQISFGNRDYVADIRGDLIFQGFTTPTFALALDPERVARSEDGIPEHAGLSPSTKPSTGESDSSRTLALNSQSQHRVSSAEEFLSCRTPRIFFSLAKPRL